MISLGDFEYNPANILGNGAFAIVYEGRFRKTPEHKVAIKAMRSSDRNLAKSKNLLNKEIAVLRDLNHPNIVRLFDHKIAAEGVYLFMEYCNGGDLAKILSERRTLPEDVISNLLAQLSSALDVMNVQGIMHRDLKPGNILLCFPPDIRFKKPSFDIYKSKIKYKLADFGFARFLQDGIMAATMCGSPMYMAPEVLLCKSYTITVDIWSMGVIIYQCLTGVAPFQANNPEALKAIYQKTLEPVRFPSHASNFLRDVIKKMLVKNPSSRISFKDIMQHPFVRGNVTVDPPRRQTNMPSDPVTQPNRPGKAKTLAEIFSPAGMAPTAATPVPAKEVTPPPPPYIAAADPRTTVKRPQYGGMQQPPPQQQHQQQLAQQTRSSAIPIPTTGANRRPADEDTSAVPTTAGVDQGFVFVNKDGSVNKEDRQKEMGDRGGFAKFFANAAQSSERSENLLEKTRTGENIQTGATAVDQSGSSNRTNVDSGHTSSNTGIYGSSTNQKPFKLSTEGYYSPKTPTEAVPDNTGGGSSSQAGFYLSRSPPTPVETASPISLVTAALVRSPGTPKESLPQYLRRNSSSGFNLQDANASLTNERRIATAPGELPKDYIDDINDLLEEPPELDEDVICSNEHREEAQKITAVLDMCELLFDLAEQRNALLSRPPACGSDDDADDDEKVAGVDTYGKPSSEDSSGSGGGLLDVISAPQRIAEQMLLYQRILHYLHTLFLEIQTAVEKRRLCATRTSSNNIRACNNLYHRCIIKLDLLIKETERNPNFGRVILSWYWSLSVNKMVFHYSLDQCSAAEMDAMVGSLDMCIRRYQAAMLLMLGLRQHAKTDCDSRMTREVTEMMQGRFIKHWYAAHDSPTVDQDCEEET